MLPVVKITFQICCTDGFFTQGITGKMPKYKYCGLYRTLLRFQNSGLNPELVLPV